MTDRDLPPHDDAVAPLDDDMRIFRPRRALPTDVVRPTRAEVNLAHLRHNLHVLRHSARGVPIWAVLKADAYGHGAKAVARTLERAGVDGICVALVEEGVELREAGITVPVLVMGGYAGSAFREFIHHDLTVVVHEIGQIGDLAREVRHADSSGIDVHLKVDTGMGRLGSRREEWQRVAEAFLAHREVRLDGLMTHFANADVAEDGVFDEPLQLFEEATALFTAAGLPPRVRHAANSAALLRGRAGFDLVRPGIALFGVDPLAGAPVERALPPEMAGKLRPVMSVHSKIVALRQLTAGDAVGYGSTWNAPRPSLVATVPMGYADGLSRALSNRGEFLVHGRRAPIVGIVSMDMTMIDVTDIPDVALGDDVVLLGAQSAKSSASKAFSASSTESGLAEITASDIARASGTIPWEVLTNISRRVPRFYREA